MQALELKLPTPVLLAWGLPEDARAFHVDDNKLFYLSDFMGLRDIRAFRVLPDGNWQLIGKLSELPEEQVLYIIGGEFCDHCSLEKKGVYGVNGGYVAGCEGSRCEDTKEAIYDRFYSAIEAEGHYLANPVPDPEYLDGGPDGGGYDSQWIKEYEEAQYKTLPGNTLIFKKK